MHQWKGELDIASIINYAGVKNANTVNQMFDMAEQSYWEAADFSYMAPERKIVFNFEVSRIFGFIFRRIPKREQEMQ